MWLQVLTVAGDPATVLVRADMTVGITTGVGKIRVQVLRTVLHWVGWDGSTEPWPVRADVE